MNSEKASADNMVTAHLGSEESGSVANAAVQELDSRVIRKLRLKVDLIILPTLAVMYTFK